MGQARAEKLDEGAKLGSAESEKRQRRTTARKIGKMIRRCKAEAKALKKLNDEQKKYLERYGKLLINDPIVSREALPRSRAAKFQAL